VKEYPRARKRFGQHFLEPAWVARLVALMAPAADETVLEIGPGRGALTRALAPHVARLVCIEIDRDLAERLRTSAPPNVEVVTGDVLTTDLTTVLGSSQGARIIGMASHTHSLGIYASIHRATSATEYTDLLHESHDWASPPFDTWTPTLVLEPGEGLRLECQYENTTDNAVSFGLDFADEMCFLGAYYY
jgi:hypothetical protein